MSFIFCNPNPCNKLTIDCSVRAVSIALDQSWDKTHEDICTLSRCRCNMPSSNKIWGEYLHQHGFREYQVPHAHERNYTVKDFCEDHPTGLYVMGLGEHVVTVINGNYYDIWDSGDEIPLYFWTKEMNVYGGTNVPWNDEYFNDGG